jgi:hypothetical protein
MHMGGGWLRAYKSRPKLQFFTQILLIKMQLIPKKVNPPPKNFPTPLYKLEERRDYQSFSHPKSGKILSTLPWIFKPCVSVGRIVLFKKLMTKYAMFLLPLSLLQIFLLLTIRNSQFAKMFK